MHGKAKQVLGVDGNAVPLSDRRRRYDTGTKRRPDRRLRHISRNDVINAEAGVESSRNDVQEPRIGDKIDAHFGIGLEEGEQDRFEDTARGAYLAAAGMMAALLRRAEEGGSYQVKLSLARSAMWVQSLGFLDTALQQALPATDDYPAKRTRVKSVYGDLSYLESPLTFSNLTLPEVDTIEPYGASPAAWL